MPLPLVESAGDDDSLAHLLGPTRAAVLSGVLGPRTTSELARDLGVSAASVSTHAKVLRVSGLITSTRDGKAVLHSITSLGAQLLATSALAGA